MARKEGWYSLRKFAYGLCKYIFIFGPILRARYSTNTTLLAALTAAEAACHELVEEIDKAAPQGV